KDWFTFDDGSREVFYFEDRYGNYVSHFLPSFAIDNVGNKTYGVDFSIENVEGNRYEIHLVLDADWLYSNERVFPIRIDPSIVHNSKANFDTGTYISSEYAQSVAGVELVGVEKPVIDENTVGYWSFDDTYTTNSDSATGGTMTTVGSEYVRTFTSSGTFTTIFPVSANVLVVAGGGGGGFNAGGGGGGGGVLYHSDVTLTPNDYSVVVGAGGDGATVNGTKGGNGGNSSFDEIVAIGGGGGGSKESTGAVGSSGGGGGHPNYAGAAGTTGQGYAGGNAGSTKGGGGGGCGALGNNNGDGGVGCTSNISGVATYYGGGGAGGNYDGGGGTGGLGGGGNGGNNSGFPGSSGTPNTGGGGGANGNVAISGGTGNKGGSGVVIVRYKNMYTMPDSTGNNNDGIVGGGNSIIGKINKGFKFDGVDNHIRLEDSTKVNIVGDITLDFWVNLEKKWSISNFNSQG
ncbi:MAG: glycine-rich domain-containing protein, partial [Candidatus Dojkabacteria bacterium]